MSTATFDPETQPGVYINRNTMRALRDKTLALAAEEPNLAWKRAYLSLADAADRVDALYARDGLAGDVTATPGIPRQ